MSDSMILNIDSDERGLIAAIVQDAATSDVVALCYLDSKALAEALHTGGAEQIASRLPALREYNWKLVDVRSNLDGHSLTVLVERDAAVARDSHPASLLNPVAESQPRKPDLELVNVNSMEFGFTISALYQLIARRKEELPEGSYTTYLFNSGLDKILKKIGEESGEVIIAAKNASSRELVSELSDLFYHLLVMMVERGVKLEEVRNELAERSSAGKKQTD